MRKIGRYMAGLFGIFALLAGCQDEEVDLQGKRVEEGIPTEVTLRYEVEANEVVSRAAQE